MKMTKERKAYALILGLAVGALVIDQALLGGSGAGPEEASATAPDVGVEVNGAAGPEAAAVGTLDRAVAVLKRVSRAAGDTDEEDTLARRLEALAAERGLEASAAEDAFRPASSWIAAPEPVGGEAPEGLAPDAAEAFTAKHELLAVLTTGRGGMVILAGRREPLRVGQALDGFTLISATRRAAVFESGGSRATLELQRPVE